MVLHTRQLNNYPHSDLSQVDVWRPADTQETAAAWREAILSQERPIAFALSRQTLKRSLKLRTNKQHIKRRIRGLWIALTLMRL